MQKEEIINAFKWSITLGKKPRGLWRPPIIIKFWYEGDDTNSLNINPEFLLIVETNYPDNDPLNTSVLNPHANFYIFNSHLKFYRQSNHRNTNFSILRMNINFYKYNESVVYPEWRPGIPDYSDYLEFLKTICEHVRNEYVRRVEEAWESEEILDEFTISSETLAYQKAQLVKKPLTRKLKIT